MKTSRLLAYAAAGMIAGLLFENRALIMKERAGKKVRGMKKKVSEAVDKVKG